MTAIRPSGPTNARPILSAENVLPDPGGPGNAMRNLSCVLTALTNVAIPTPLRPQPRACQTPPPQSPRPLSPPASTRTTSARDPLGTQSTGVHRSSPPTA